MMAGLYSIDCEVYRIEKKVKMGNILTRMSEK
jgi:hypothetical protein